MIGLVNRIAIVVFPKKPFVDWADSIDEGGRTHDLGLIRQCPSIHLVSDDPALCTGDEMVKYYMQPIFDGWLDSWNEDESKWPKDRSWEVFKEWFEWLEVPQIADLEETELKAYPLDPEDPESAHLLRGESPE